MENAKEKPACGIYPQPRFVRYVQWLAIPMTAKRLYKLICMSVLPPAKPFAIAPTVLQQQDFSGGSTNSPGFLKRCDRIRKCTRRQRRDYRVESVVAKRQGLRVRQRSRAISGRAPGRSR
jgi:hypothetical protein